MVINVEMKSLRCFNVFKHLCIFGPKGDILGNYGQHNHSRQLKSLWSQFHVNLCILTKICPKKWLAHFHPGDLELWPYI